MSSWAAFHRKLRNSDFSIRWHHVDYNSSKDLLIFFCVLRVQKKSIFLAACPFTCTAATQPVGWGSGTLSPSVPSSHLSQTQRISLGLLHDRWQTLRWFLAVFSLRAHFLLRFDNDVNGPYATSLLYGFRGELAIALTHLLLCWRPNGPQALGRCRLCSWFGDVSLQLVVGVRLWADPLCGNMETKDIKRQLEVFTKELCWYVCSYGISF